jgi:WG containing repeat
MTYMRRIAVLFVALQLVLQTAKSEQLHNCTMGNARAVYLDETWLLMQDDGHVLLTGSYCAAGELSDGLIRFDFCGEKRTVYVTPNGDVVVMVNAVQARDFGEGLAAVEDDRGYWGYIDKTGHFAIAAKFQDAEKFSDGAAAVKVNDEWQYIDRTGNTVLKPHRKGMSVFAAYPFKAGVALIVLFDANTNTYEKGLIDRSGKWRLTPTDRLTGEMDNGLAPLWSASTNKMGFIDASGRTVIPAQFTGNASLPFQDGLAAVYIENERATKAGFIDKKGQWVIPPIYDDAYHFCNGLAPVKVENAWGFIDKTGSFVIPAQFAAAESFEGGIAEVMRKDNLGELHRELINLHGSVLFHSSKVSELIEIKD